MGITTPPGNWSGTNITWNGGVGRTNYQHGNEQPPPQMVSEPVMPQIPPEPPVIGAAAMPLSQVNVQYMGVQPSAAKRL